MDFENAYNLIVEKLSLWLQQFIRLLPNMLLAAFVLVIGIWLASRFKNIFHKLIHKFIQRQILANLFASVVQVFLIGVTVFIALSILGLDKAVTSILAGAGIIGLALAFAFQDIAANFISGIFITFRRPMNVGDIVKLNGYMGRVEEINLRDTVIRSFQGQMVVIPNKIVFQNPIENYSLLGKRRFDLTIGVSYGDDLEKVKRVTLEAVKGIKNLSDEDEVTIFYTEFGESAINFEIRMWVNSTEQSVYKQVGNDAILQIKKAYDENDIMIPFPIRTMDFGIKGGVKLNAMMKND